MPVQRETAFPTLLAFGIEASYLSPDLKGCDKPSGKPWALAHTQTENLSHLEYLPSLYLYYICLTSHVKPR
jgi:hypothetical protein